MGSTWEEVEGGTRNRIWNLNDAPEGNGILVGRFDGTRVISTKDNFGGGMRESTIHDVTLESGETVSIWGAVDLDSKLDQLSRGDAVRVAYIGKEEVTTRAGIKRQIKKYTVNRAPGSSLSIASGNGDGTGSSDDDIPF